VKPLIVIILIGIVVFLGSLAVNELGEMFDERYALGPIVGQSVAHLEYSEFRHQIDITCATKEYCVEAIQGANISPEYFKEGLRINIKMVEESYYK